MFGTLASGDIETARLRRDLRITCNLGFSCGGGFEDIGMRLEGENLVPPQRGGDGEVVNETVPFHVERPLFQQTQKLVVGYALTSKKKKSFLQPKLEYMAR